MEHTAMFFFIDFSAVSNEIINTSRCVNAGTGCYVPHYSMLPLYCIFIGYK